MQSTNAGWQGPLLDSLAEATVVTDAAGTILLWTRADQFLFGWTPAEAGGKSLLDFVDPSSRETAVAGLATLNGGETWNDSLMMRRRDGRRVQVEVNAAPILDHAGDLVAIAGTFKAVNESAVSEAVLRTNADILNLIAHEVRNPLSVIIGNAGLLARKAESMTQEIISSVGNDLLSEAGRLQKSFENLLALTRPFEPDRETEPVDLAGVARRMIDIHKQSYPHRSVMFSHPNGSVVQSNESFIEIVLSNLLTNAEKYSPADQPIEVTIEPEDGSVVLKVADHGPGIPDEERAHIFTPFYRAPSTRAAAQGLGIGLAACRRLTEALGGNIEMANRPEGGAVFSVHLPANGR